MPAKPKAPTTPSPVSVVQVPVADVQTSDAIQPRSFMNPSVIEEYATLYREQDDGEPEPLPALDVFQINDEYYVADGFHRLAAARKAQRTTLPCQVYQGTVQDALRHAALANLKRGLAYTHVDKQRVLERLVVDPEVGQRSDRAIARDLGISHVTVGRARQRLAHVATLTEALRAQPTTAATHTARSQERVAALLAIPIEDTALLAKHHDLKPEEIVHSIAQRMADRKESAEEATQVVARGLKSRAELYTLKEWEGDRRAQRPRESAEAKALRQAETLRWERSRRLQQLLSGFHHHLPYTPSAEEASRGDRPFTPYATVEEMVEAVQERDREDIIECLTEAYTFLDAVKAACVNQGWRL